MALKKILPALGMSLLALIYSMPGFDNVPAGAGPELRSASPSDVAFIRSLIERISEAELRRDVQALQDMGTRYAPSRGNLRAAEYIRNDFISCGLNDSRFDDFSYYDDQTRLYGRSRNVIASLSGLRTPGKIVILGAHFDTITRSAEDGRVSALDPENPSPGADDNGTGVATVLAAARLLSALHFDCTIRFIAFSAEEAGILGSAHYAAEAARRGEDIVAVINVDQIGHVKDETEDIDVFANRKSTWLLDKVTNRSAVYAPGLPLYRVVNDTYDGSDHAPFWSNGYAAVCFMEDYYPSYRLYHTPRDTAEGIHFPFFLKTARLAVGITAELAGLEIDEAQTASKNMPGRGSHREGVDWRRDSGRKFLFAVSPSPNKADIIDISLPGISSGSSLSLGEIPPETWGQPRFYPIAACAKPGDKFVYVPMIKLRAPGKDTERGCLEIVDLEKGQVIETLDLGRNPAAGCFNAKGTLFYQPYRDERYLDVIDTASRKSIGRIGTMLPLSKLAVLEGDGRAVGLSPEADSVVVINLAQKRTEQVMTGIPVPQDVVTGSDRFAWVCGGGQAKIIQLDINAKRIVGEIGTGPQPTRLLLSPRKDLLMVLHRLSPRVDIFNLVRSKDSLTLEKKKTLDLGEVVLDGTFTADGACYFVSAGKSRLFGLDLTSRRVFWAVRSGGVRGRSEVEEIIGVGQ